MNISVSAIVLVKNPNPCIVFTLHHSEKIYVEYWEVSGVQLEQISDHNIHMHEVQADPVSWTQKEKYEH